MYIDRSEATGQLLNDLTMENDSYGVYEYNGYSSRINLACNKSLNLSLLALLSVGKSFSMLSSSVTGVSPIYV